MKGSDRSILSGGVTLSYRIKNFQFRDKLSIDYNDSHNSPYGTFSTYARLNPYSRLYDSVGNYIQGYDYENLNRFTIYNPLYNTTMNTIDKDFNTNLKTIDE